MCETRIHINVLMPVQRTCLVFYIIAFQCKIHKCFEKEGSGIAVYPHFALSGEEAIIGGKMPPVVTMR